MVDRHSPKRILMVTKYLSFVLLGVLAVLVLSGTLKLWMIFVLAFCIGLSSAFSIPSATSILPYVVKPEQLQVAHSVTLSLRQVTIVTGPLLAGVMIAIFGDGGAGMVGSAYGLGLAFLLDALSFILSAWTLYRVKVYKMPSSSIPTERHRVLGAIAVGLRWCWNDRDLRVCFLYWAAVMFFSVGPLQVSIPVLAGQLNESATTFGILAGMHGAGILIGMIFCGVKPNLRLVNFGSTMLFLDFIIGGLFILMWWVNATWQGALVLTLIGLLNGFLQVAVYTWIQRRVAPEMLGRAMSLFMFIVVGITPISAAIAGVLMRQITPNAVFMGSGVLLIAIVLVTLLMSSMRSVMDVRQISGMSPG